LILLATGISSIEEELIKQIEAQRCYNRDILIDVVREVNPKAVILSPHLPGSDDLFESVFFLRNIGKRIVFLPGDPKLKDAQDWMINLITYGVYDYVYDPVTAAAIVERLNNPATLGDIPYSITKASQENGTALSRKIVNSLHKEPQGKGILGFLKSDKQPPTEEARPYLPKETICPTSNGGDALTGLPTRSAITNLTIPRQLAVLFCDLDKFKAVNDNYGHAVGDKILQEFAHVLRCSLREGDIPIRWGGDEFVILIAGASHREALFVKERIKEHWKTNRLAKSYKVSVSIGVAASNEKLLEQVIADADTAMYQEKKRGNTNTPLFTICIDELSDDLIKTLKNSAIVDADGMIAISGDDFWKHDCRMGLQSVPKYLKHKVWFYGLSQDISGLGEDDLERMTRLVLDLIARQKRVFINASSPTILEWAAEIGAVPWKGGQS
jgi:diguanylate cyclase (GGDEF)-like protein